MSVINAGIQINSFSLVVEGNVGRKLTNDGKDTELTLTLAQAQQIHADLSGVLTAFGLNGAGITVPSAVSNLTVRDSTGEQHDLPTGNKA